MAGGKRARAKRKRVGLVLGAGGTLGAAWTIGGLAAVEERIGRPLAEVDVIVGTSAGSIVAAALRHGFTPAELVAHQLGDRPTRIGDRRYVDGGVRSAASLDLLHDQGLDEVFVLAPMASRHTDRPVRPSWRAERAVRQAFAAQLAGERCKVERAGTPVTVVMPGPADLTAIGLNLMDGRRREQVLRTAQVTVAAALRRAGPAAA